MAHLISYLSVVGIIFLQTFAQVSASGAGRLEKGEVLSRDPREVGHDHGAGDGEVFAIVGNYLLEAELADLRVSLDFESNHDSAVISKSQVLILVSTLFSRLGCEQRVGNCSKCATSTTDDLFSALNLNDTDGFSEESLHEAAPTLLYITTELEAVCSGELSVAALDEDTVFLALMTAGADGANDTLTEEDLAEILHHVGENYTATTQATCFDVESIFIETVVDHEAGANTTETHAVAEHVVSALLQGHCVGEATLPTTESFTDAVFGTYSIGGYIVEDEFFHMLELLGIGGAAGAVAHDGHAHRRRRRDAAIPLVESLLSAHNRAKRVVDPHDHAHSASETNVTGTCFSGEELLTIFGVDHEVGLSESQFKDIAPSLIQQILDGACAVVNTTTTAVTITDAEMWGYGTLAVFLISLCAVVGALLIPFMSGFVYQAVIQLLIALAVATLTGDAVLHLIPQAVGLHAHDPTAAVDAHTSHGPTNPELAYVWKCFVVAMAIYAFFLFESAAGFLSCGAHTHSHGGQQVELSQRDLERRNSAKVYRNRSEAERNKFSSKNNLTSEGNESDVSAAPPKRSFWAGCGTVSFMIIIGDSLHNFGDGLAIGAAFAAGIGPGISTSIAVLCHELPHELGDLAVLLNQGMSLCTAICLNFMSACTAFIGLWIGIPVSQNQTTREWIFAATAGIFLYVGLVSMLPQLHAYNGKRRSAIFVLQNIGFLVGTAIILVIALYEDSISVNI